jgi:hypothetical protein
MTAIRTDDARPRVIPPPMPRAHGYRFRPGRRIALGRQPDAGSPALAVVGLRVPPRHQVGPIEMSVLEPAKGAAPGDRAGQPISEGGIVEVLYEPLHAPVAVVRPLAVHPQPPLRIGEPWLADSLQLTRAGGTGGHDPAPSPRTTSERSRVTASRSSTVHLVSPSRAPGRAPRRDPAGDGTPGVPGSRPGGSRTSGAGRSPRPGSATGHGPRPIR